MAMVIARLVVSVATFGAQATAMRLGSRCKEDRQQQDSEVDQLHLI